MDLGLKGKKAVVTGGTRGIGRAIADLLADEGADVAICARNPAEVEAAASALSAKGVTATGGVVDVADSTALDQWMTAAADTLGGIDIVVPNVSALAGGGDRDAWRRSLDVDIMGTVHTVEAALPYLEKSDAGSIVVISSVSGLEILGPDIRPYNTVKAGLIAYVSNVSTLLARKGIRANTVSPGTIFFEGGVWDQRRINVPDVYKWALSRNPMGRMGTPEEVARAAVFLASPAASFITGTNLVVDGAITQRIQF